MRTHKYIYLHMHGRRAADALVVGAHGGAELWRGEEEAQINIK
jgi:hypothetical protein